ncbi:AAA family ATPase [Brevibacillus parabrevis]|uniref:AAA family ATPase n=1 Tax=Brevibacillus parabrevis TaxID=54914 RepID=UPI003D1C8C04
MAKIEIIKSMLSNDRGNAHAWFLLGMEHAELGDRTEALQAFTQALSLGDGEIKDKVAVELNKLQREMPFSKSKKGSASWEASLFGWRPSRRIQVIEGGKGKAVEHGCALPDFTTGYHSVGGLQAEKEVIVNTFAALTQQGVVHERGERGGILLYGPSGCGKSLLAKATAEECRVPFFPIAQSAGSDVMPYLAESSFSAVAEADSYQNKPLLVFWDELDGRQGPQFAYHKQVDTEFAWLAKLGEWQQAERGLFLMGATTVPWELDIAWLREIGFAQMLFVSPPDRAARAEIFRLKLRGRPAEPIDYAQLAGWTEFYSGADIEYVVELATEQVLHDFLTKGVERPIQMSDLRESIAATRSTTIEWLRTVKEHLQEINRDGHYAAVAQYLDMHRRI